MDITLARTFLTICDLGSFIKASERLHLTQSTISTRVKVMEGLLGQSLFVRTKAGASLTAAGTQFKPFAEKLVQIWEQARHNVGLPVDFTAALTVGVEFTLWERLLVNWISWIRSELVDVAVRTEVGSSESLMAQLIDGRLDLAVSYTPQHRSGMIIEELTQDSIVLVSSNESTRGPWEDGYIFVDWGDEFRMEHMNAFPHLTAPVLSVSYGPLAQQYILLNQGSAYLPLRVVQPRLGDGSLHLVRDAPVFQRAIFVAYLDDDDSGRCQTAVRGLRHISEMNPFPL